MRPRLPDRLEEMMEEEVEEGVPVYQYDGFGDKRQFIINSVSKEIRRIKEENKSKN